MSFNIRMMQESDLNAVIRIQNEVYSGHFLESPEVIAERFALSARTSWVAERDGEVGAYLVGYWSKIGKISALHAAFKILDNVDCLYLHDLALLNKVQGFGLAKMLIEAAADCANEKNASAIALMSVQNSVSFWNKMGFSEFTNLDKEQYKNLSTYQAGDEPAQYMVRYL